MHPVTEPFDAGLLDVGDGHALRWELWGTPGAEPAVVLHGGPGSGATPWWRQFFDPARYQVLLFDQRGCGGSTPHAGDPVVDLATNTTAHLVADVELLREHVGVERWFVLGGSWGSTLALAYAVAHPRRVTAMALWAVVTTTAHEVDWLTHRMGELYPEAIDALLEAVPEADRRGNVPLALNRLLCSPDLEVHGPAAEAWCAWEDRLATLSGPVRGSRRFEDPRFRLAFARLVTHYFGHHGFLPDGWLREGVVALGDVPAVLVRGRLDIASPLRPAHDLAAAWPAARLHVVEDDAHGDGATTNDILVAATDRFAATGALW